MGFLSNQRMGDIPSKCEMGTRTLIRSASYCVQTLLGVGIAPNRSGAHLPRNGDIALATGLIVLIAHPCMGGRPWKCSVGCPTVCTVLG
jgi:hypothetical protein